MQVVHAPTHSLARCLWIIVVAHEQAGRIALLKAGDADRTLFAIRHFHPIIIQQLHVEERRGLAHGARSRIDPGEGGEQHRAFRLTEALADLLARQALPLDGHLSIQRLARSGEVLDAREVIGRHVLLKHEAIHGRRSAERGQLIVLDLLEQLRRNELLHVIGEDGGSADPLPVDLPPAELRPAGVGHAHVQRVLLDLLPIPCRDDMPERMGERVLHRLRVARRAAREVDEHDVLGGHPCLPDRASECIALAFDQGIERGPTLALSCHDHQVLQGGSLRKRALHLADHIGIIHADDGLHLRAVHAVDHILRGQLQGCRDDDGAQLRQGHCHHPVFPSTAQDGHDHITLADAHPLEGIGCLVGEARDVRECERALLARIVHPEQCALLRFDPGPFVHHVVAEVERLRHLDAEALHEVLVGIELYARAIRAQYMICHGLSAILLAI